MKRRSLFGLAAMGLCVAVSTLLVDSLSNRSDLYGQPPGFRMPGFGPPGFGPPGFGPPGFGPPGLAPSVSVVQLLEMPEVQVELKLNKEQKAKVELISEKAREQAFASMRGFDFREMFLLEEVDRIKRMEEMRSKIDSLNAELEKEILPSLGDLQRARLNQIKLQSKSTAALLLPEVADPLKLDDDQKVRLKKLIDSQTGPEEASKKVSDVLTKEQQERWISLQGPKFNLPAFSPFGGPGGLGGPMGGPDRKLVAQFDKNGNKRLEKEERKAAREFANKEPRRGPFGGPGGPGGGPGRLGGGPAGGFGPPGFPGLFGGESEPVKPGPKVDPKDAPRYPEASMYSTSVVRTLFVNFEDSDWEQEMADFYRTDVDVPASLQVDGKVYPGIGVHFRGMSSFGMVGAGRKRSLNIALDHVDADQRLYGKKTLNLLNAHEDASFLNTVLYLEIAQKYTKAPKANFVHVVINGESWGLYVNAEQFNKEFVEENFGTASGARWKVPGSPMGRGGLEYVGDNIEDYKKTFEIKTKDTAESWQSLVELCRILNETPIEALKQKIEPILDIEGTLAFLALEATLVNNDGYWTRASDYSLYRDPKGVFHVLIHDANEAFRAPMGPGFGGPGGPGFGGAFGPGGGRMGPVGRGPGARGPEGRGPEASGPESRGPEPRVPETQAAGERRPRGTQQLDPLVGMTDSSKPLRSRLLQVPEYKERYLALVKRIANDSLDPVWLGQRISSYRSLIDDYVQKDTRKLSSYAAFVSATRTEPTAQPQKEGPGLGPREQISILDFAKQRREYIQNYRP